jgi:SAM-dependent methyltransferase
VTAAISALDAYAAALAGRRCHVVVNGGSHPLPVRRWTGGVTASDQALLDHCVGSTLDIGCGPGRMAAALSEAGHVCLGIDVSTEAVVRARARGAAAVVADVFSAVPAAGSWDTALLADGNIGIGGDPVRLLRRIAGVVAPRAVVVADLAPPGVPMRTRHLRLAVDGRRTTPFAWAVVGVDSVPHVARAADFAVDAVVESRGRWFCRLRVGRSRGRLE